MKKIFFYETKIGEIVIADELDYITDLSLKSKFDAEKCEVFETPLIKKAYSQLCEYLKGERQDFDLPLKPIGTPFQVKVWETLRQIPYGETRSYKEIAQNIGNEKACRAVGMANNKNPILIITPCHRVIGANGDLVGFGAGIGVKEILLSLEKDNVKN